MGGSFSSDPIVSETKSEPLVSEKPKEGTPLLQGGSPDDMVKTAKERTQTLLSLVALVGIAVLKTQLTAHLFTTSHFPTAYSLWSCIMTCALLVPVFILRPSSWAVPKREAAGVLSLIVIFTAADLGFTNIALAEISTALQQCIASTNPFWTIVIESVLHRRMQHVVVYATVTTLVVGAVLASFGSVARFSHYGVAAACLAVLSSASKYVFTHKAFQAFKGDIGPLALLFWVDLFMIPIYLVATLISGELIELSEQCLGSLTVFLNTTGIASLGGLRALTQFVVLTFVSATSMSTANIFTQVLNIIISIPLQGTPVTPLLVTGISTTITFSAFYAFIKAYRPFLTQVDEVCGCAKPREEMKPAV